VQEQSPAIRGDVEPHRNILAVADFQGLLASEGPSLPMRRDVITAGGYGVKSEDAFRISGGVNSTVALDGKQFDPSAWQHVPLSVADGSVAGGCLGRGVYRTQKHSQQQATYIPQEACDSFGRSSLQRNNFQFFAWVHSKGSALDE
jgi:hypothetical protein